ncbi:MAG TPA: AgmX/PglI C-terminal domain-containing protein [Polyangiaceae bacterium]|nr:AgmX/PglI C-terminal domain-containing protein [Polyangiaceae bacterium]
MKRHQVWVCAAVLSGVVACGGSAPSGAPPETAATPPTEAKPAEAPAEAAKPSTADSSAESTGSAPASADDAAPAGDPDTRTMEVIAATVKEHRKDARACYEKGAKQVPGLKGDLVVHFVLTPSGKVKSAELNKDRSTITEPSVVSCVVDVISGIEFPKSSRGMETSVNYPFNFTP